MQLIAIILLAVISIGMFLVYNILDRTYYVEYTESGSLEKFTDHINGKVTTYVYDLDGRFVSYTERKTAVFWILPFFCR